MSGEARKGGPGMSDLDELVARPVVLSAGRVRPGRGVAERKATRLYIESQALTGIAQWFCAAVTRSTARWH